MQCDLNPVLVGFICLKQGTWHTLLFELGVEPIF